MRRLTKVHQVTLTLRFDTSCSQGQAVRAARDEFSGQEFFPVALRPIDPTRAAVRGVMSAVPRAKRGAQ